MPAILLIMSLLPSFIAMNGTTDPDPQVREASRQILQKYGFASYPAYVLYSQDSRPAVQMARRQVEMDWEEKLAQMHRKAIGPAPEEWRSPAQWGHQEEDEEDDMEQMAKDGADAI